MAHFRASCDFVVEFPARVDSPSVETSTGEFCPAGARKQGQNFALYVPGTAFPEPKRSRAVSRDVQKSRFDLIQRTRKKPSVPRWGDDCRRETRSFLQQRRIAVTRLPSGDGGFSCSVCGQL